jgi:hypothetical protein
MRALLVGATLIGGAILPATPVNAACPAVATDCPSTTMNNLTVGGTATFKGLVSGPGAPVTAQTVHDEVTGTDGVIAASSTAFSSASANFTQQDRGKTIILNGLGVAGADLVTTIASVADAHDVTLAAATTYAAPWYQVGNAWLATGATITSNYAVGDTLTVSGGTGVTAAGVFTIVALQANNLAVNAGGTGGTPGACTITGTTGVTRTTYQTSALPSSSKTNGWFQATGTVSGGALTGPLTITQSGDYITPPTNTAAEPVTGCGLTGATVSLKMAPLAMQQTAAGHYTALPSNPVSTTTSGSGVGATLTLYYTSVFNHTFDGLPTQIGGLWAYGTDDTAAINNAIAAAAGNGGGTVMFPCGRSLMTGAFAIPYTGTAPPKQPSLRLTGCGQIGTQTLAGHWDSFYTAGVVGSIIDNRFAGDGGTHVAKLDTRGMGFLQLDGFTLQDYGTDNFLFMQTTNTTINVSITFMGNPTCFHKTCQQDAVRVGGITAAALGNQGNNAASALAQGEGSTISNAFFDHIREAVEFGAAADGLTLNNNTVAYDSGSNLPIGAAYHFYGVGGGGVGAVSNSILGGVVEMGGYMYAIAQTSLSGGQNQQNYFNFGAQDETLGNPTVGLVYSDVNSMNNTIVPIYYGVQLHATVSDGAGGPTNLVLDTSSNTTAFPNNINVGHGVGSTAIVNLMGSTGTNGGAALLLYNAGNFTGLIGNYSIARGGSYNSALSLVSTGAILMPTDALGVQSGPSITGGLVSQFGPGTGNQSVGISGGNTNSADGARLLIYNGASITGYIGNYSAIIGGAYNSSLTLKGTNTLLIPSDALGVQSGTSVTTGLVSQFGAGANNISVGIAGGATNSADGARLLIYNGASITGYIGNYSAIIGGAYNSSLTLKGTNTLLMPGDNLGIKTGSSVLAGLNLQVGSGSGQIYSALNGGNTNAADGAGYEIYNNGVKTGFFGNYSAIIGGAFTQRMAIYSSGQGVQIPSDSLIVGAPTGLDKGVGTINAVGPYYANGIAGVSCAAAGVVLSTFTVSNGIVTHC